jgi:hypothetical protein
MLVALEPRLVVHFQRYPIPMPLDLGLLSLRLLPLLRLRAVLAGFQCALCLIRELRREVLEDGAIHPHLLRSGREVNRVAIATTSPLLDLGLLSPILLLRGDRLLELLNVLEEELFLRLLLQSLLGRLVKLRYLREVWVLTGARQTGLP